MNTLAEISNMIYFHYPICLSISVSIFLCFAFVNGSKVLFKYQSALLSLIADLSNICDKIIVIFSCIRS